MTAPINTAPETAPAPALSPIEQAVAAARETMAAQGTMIPEPTPDPLRNEDGTFKAAETPAAEAPEGEAAPEGEQTPEGEAAPEGEAPEPETPETPEPVVVSLPGRRPEDPDFEIEVTSPEAAERLAQLRNGYMRAEEVRAERATVEGLQAQLAEVEDAMATDPVGYITSTIPKDVQAHVAMTLLTQPGVWESLVDDLTMLAEDPKTLELARQKLRGDSLEMRETLKQRAVARRESMENARKVQEVVEQIANTGLEASKADQFRNDAIGDLMEYVRRTGVQRLDPQDVPYLLMQRCRHYGLDPVKVAQALSQDPGPSGKTTSTPPSKVTASVKATAAPKMTGDKFVQGQAQRKAAAAAAPSGAGAPSAAVTPPAGQTIQERLEWAKANIGALRAASA